MKKTRPLFWIAVCIAACVPLVQSLRSRSELAEKRRFFEQQKAALSHEMDNRSRGLNSTAVTGTLSRQEVLELARLRSEVGSLRRLKRSMEVLSRENERLQKGIHDLENLNPNEVHSAAALFDDEAEIRRDRVALLKDFLEERPDLKIPEMAYVKESDLLRQLEYPLVTDEDFRGQAAVFRAESERKLVPLLQSALKKFSQEHGGEFPSQLAQLRPYFSEPLDPSILDRYQIVPPRSLPGFLAETKGDWVITQKAPIDSHYDIRFAVGMSDFRGTGEEGRWKNAGSDK